MLKPTAPLLTTLSVLTLTLTTLTACPGEGDGDGGGEGEGEGEEEQSAESCSTAGVITAGTPIQATTTGAADDVANSCTFTPGAAGDKVYSFTVTEPSSATATLESDVDLNVAIYNAADCLEDNEVVCADEGETRDVATAAVLDPGTYFVVVDGSADISGDFTLTLEFGDPQCVGDQFEGQDANNDTFASAINAGGAALDTAALEDGEGGTQALPLNLCPGDVDYFLITHLGGALAVSVTAIAGTPSADLRLATVDLAATLAGNGEIAVTGEGAPIALSATSNLAAGYYLLRVSESGATVLDPAEYSFAIAPSCEADGRDSPLAGLDDAALVLDPESNGVTDDIDADSAVESFICNGNADAFAFDPLTTGDLVLSFTGAADLQLAVTSVVRGQAVESPVTTMTDTTTGGTRTLTVTDIVPTNRYVVRVAQATATTTSTPYGLSVDFRYDPPANDLCADAEAITATPTATVVSGSNVAGTSNMDGLCNGDIDAEADKKGVEVFYGLTLTGTTNLELKVAGTDDEFSGDVTLFAAPDGCPTDLSTLRPIGVSGSQVTAAEIGAACGQRIRLQDVPAGDYLAVVEGAAGGFVIIFDIPPSVGPFSLTTQTYPDGFPPAEACTEALPITLPAAGTSSQTPIAFADFSAENDITGSCGGNGQERVLSFTASSTTEVTFSTPSGDDAIDTVLYLVSGACGGSDVDSCNDDNGESGTGSTLTANVVAGTSYFLVVDTYGAITSGSTTLTVSVP